VPACLEAVPAGGGALPGATFGLHAFWEELGGRVPSVPQVHCSLLQVTWVHWRLLHATVAYIGALYCDHFHYLPLILCSGVKAECIIDILLFLYCLVLQLFLFPITTPGTD